HRDRLGGLGTLLTELALDLEAGRAGLARVRHRVAERTLVGIAAHGEPPGLGWRQRERQTRGASKCLLVVLEYPGAGELFDENLASVVHDAATVTQRSAFLQVGSSTECQVCARAVGRRAVGRDRAGRGAGWGGQCRAGSERRSPPGVAVRAGDGP